MKAPESLKLASARFCIPLNVCFIGAINHPKHLKPLPAVFGLIWLYSPNPNFHTMLHQSQQSASCSIRNRVFPFSHNLQDILSYIQLGHRILVLDFSLWFLSCHEFFSGSETCHLLKFKLSLCPWRLNPYYPFQSFRHERRRRRMGSRIPVYEILQDLNIVAIVLNLPRTCIRVANTCSSRTWSGTLSRSVQISWSLIQWRKSGRPDVDEENEGLWMVPLSSALIHLAGGFSARDQIWTTLI